MQHSDIVRPFGLFIRISINVTDAWAKLLRADGEIVPDTIVGLGLIDTGATRTCVALPVVEKLGVHHTGQTVVHTPIGVADHKLYDLKLKLEHLPHQYDVQSVIGTPISAPGTQLVALIGRDILKDFVLTYNGPKGTYVLST